MLTVHFFYAEDKEQDIPHRDGAMVGPFDYVWVQMHELYGGNRAAWSRLAVMLDNGDWKTDDGERWSDFIIAAGGA